jgi:DNA polymerase III delta prime subunit
VLENTLLRIKNGHVNHAYCLVGDLEKCFDVFLNIVQLLNIDPQEQWLEREDSIGIEKVRQLEKWLSKRPLNGEKKIAYLSLNGVRNDALTAMLKTIEEPPSYAINVLSINNINNVLGTIKSRCQTVWVGGSQEGENTSIPVNLNTFISLPELLEKTSSSEIIDLWLKDIRKDVRLGQNLLWANELFRLKKYTNTNVNSRLLLENALLAGMEIK